MIKMILKVEEGLLVYSNLINIKIKIKNLKIRIYIFIIINNLKKKNKI